MHRPTLAAFAIILLTAGVIVTYLIGAGEEQRLWGGVLFRGGALLGAVWLVLPSARRVRKWTLLPVGAFIVIVAYRPRLIGYALVISAVLSLGALRARVGRSPE